MTPFTAPTGRLIWGNPFKAVVLTEDDGKTPKRNKQTGEVETEYAFGVAYAKNDPNWPPFLALLKAEDRAAWPQFHDAQGVKLPGVVFADKITDGDGRNRKGLDLSTRDGYAGHWLVKYASRFPPTCYAFQNGAWVQLTDPASIKPGYYVQVNGSTQSNNATGTNTPGMYRNVNMVAFIAYGPEIQSGGDPNEAFGAAPGALPPGASATPLAPAPMPVPPSAALTPPQPPSAALTPPVAYAAPPPVPSVTPPAPTAPMSPSSPVMTAAATATYAQYKEAGWTDDQLIAAGLIVAPNAGFMTPPPAPKVPVMLPAANGIAYADYIARGWTDDQLVMSGFMAAG